MLLKLPIRINATDIINVSMYPRTGSLLWPYPFANHTIPGYNLSLQSAWKTFGADTKEAKAEDNVAAKHPAYIIGPTHDTSSITYHEYKGN